MRQGRPKVALILNGRRTRATRLVGRPVPDGAAPGASRADHSAVRRGLGQQDGGQAAADVADHGVQMAQTVCARPLGRDDTSTGKLMEGVLASFA